MANLDSITLFLDEVGTEPQGCPPEELASLKCIIQEASLKDISPAQAEAFYKSIRKLCNSDLDNGTSFIHVLLDHGLLNTVKAVLEKFRNDAAFTLDGMDLICAMSDSDSSVKTTLAEAFSSSFLDEAIKTTNFHYLMEIVKSINILMERCSISCREKLIADPEMKSKLKTLAKKIYTAGDYEIQGGIIECLFRFIPRRHRAEHAKEFFSDSDSVQQFLDIKDNVFETDCRGFLNSFNSKLSSKIRVFSYPCLSAQLGSQQLKKPSDTGYTDFWVDFNAGMNRISLFCEQVVPGSQGPEDAWESVFIWKKDLRSYNLDLENSPITITLSFKTPLEDCIPGICSGQKESYALLTFESKMAGPLTTALISCFGTELKWKKTKEHTTKASQAVSPVHLNVRQPQVQSDANSNEEEETIKPSQIRTEEKRVPQKPKTGYQKVSVPRQPMMTPARLTISEIQKAVFQKATKMKANEESSNSDEYTPSKSQAKKVVQHSPLKDPKTTGFKHSASSKDPKTTGFKHSPSSKDPKTTGFKHSPSSKDPKTTDSFQKAVEEKVSEEGNSSNDRTPSKGLQKKPVKHSPSLKVVADGHKSNDSTPSKAQHNKAFKHSSSFKDPKLTDNSTPKTPVGKRTRSGGKVKTPLILEPSSANCRGKSKKKQSTSSESEAEKCVTSGKASDHEDKPVTKNNKSIKLENLAEKDVNCYQSPKAAENNDYPMETEDYIQNVITIPDSLPIDNPFSTEHNDAQKSENKRKSLNDSGISLHDLSGSENPSKNNINKGTASPDNAQVTESTKDDLIPSETNNKNSAIVEEHSGEISVASSLEPSATFPKRTLRSTAQGLTSPVSVINETQMNIAISSTDEIENSPQSKPQRGKSKVTKRQSNLKPAPRSKSKPKGKTKDNVTCKTKPSQVKEDKREENGNLSYLKPELNKLFSLQSRPLSGKTPIYRTLPSPHYKQQSQDPYEFMETESNSTYPVSSEKKTLVKSKANKFFTSKNKSNSTQLEIDKLHVSDQEISFKKDSPSRSRSKLVETTKSDHLEKNERSCFGFDSPPKIFTQESPQNDAAGELTCDFNESNNQKEKRVTTSAEKRRSGNYYNLLALQKIKEKVEKAGFPSPKAPDSPCNEVTVVSEDEEFSGNQLLMNSSPQDKKKNIDKEKIPEQNLGQDLNNETETSDDNIIANFKNICKGLLEDSGSREKQEKRRRKPVTYKELSDSDADADSSDEEISDESSSVKRPSSLTKSAASDNSLHEMDSRSELSWLGSERKKKKRPIKTYKQKSNQFNNITIGSSSSFDFKSFRPIRVEEGLSVKESVPWLKSPRQISTKEEKVPNEAVQDEDDLQVIPMVDYSSKVLTVTLTPLKLEQLENDDLGMEHISGLLKENITLKDQNGLNLDEFGYPTGYEALKNSFSKPQSKDQNCVDLEEFGYHTGEENEDESGKEEDMNSFIKSTLSAPKSVSSVSRKNKQKSKEPIAIEDDAWNQDYNSMPMVIDPLTQRQKKTQGVSKKGIQSGLISGPSSTNRLTKSAAKRKYEDYLAGESDDDDDDDNGSDGIAEENLSQGSPPEFSLRPRKLFRTEKKSQSFERRDSYSFEATTSNKSSTSFSEEALADFDVGDISIHKGVTAFIQTFGVDIQKQIKEKQQRLSMLAKGATKSTEKHLNNIWMEQSETRSRLMGQLRESMLKELLELEKDVTRLKDAEDQTVDAFKRQLSVLQTCRKSQEQRLKNLVRLHNGYGKRMDEAAVLESRQQLSVKENLKSELSALHRKVLKDTQQQEMGKFRRSLKSLI